MHANSCLSVPSTTVGIFFTGGGILDREDIQLLLVNGRDGYHYLHIVLPPPPFLPGFQPFTGAFLMPFLIRLENNLEYLQ